MKTLVARLYDLQQLDDQIQEIKKDPMITSLTSEIERLNKRLEVLKEEEERLESERKEKERLIKRKDDQEQSLGHRRKELEEEMYSGKVGAKELSQIQRKISTLLEQREGLSDEILLLFEEVELLEEQIKERREKNESLKEEKRERERRLSQKQKENEKRREAVEKEIEDLFEEIDPSYRALYQEVKENRGGRAVVSVEGSYCLGCRVGLPATIIDRLYSSEELVYCESCKRILYLKKD